MGQSLDGQADAAGRGGRRQRLVPLKLPASTESLLTPHQLAPRRFPGAVSSREVVEVVEVGRGREQAPRCGRSGKGCGSE